MLDFRIYTFLTVCNYMNFTKAAEQLHITQPAVSQHIRYLEENYQTKLFIHDGKTLRLSPAGKMLLQTASTIKNDDFCLRHKIQHIEASSIPFYFGVTQTIGEYVISNALVHYKKAHPETTIHATFANTSELLPRLSSGELNFALVEGYFQDDVYSSINFSLEDYIPVCSSKHVFEKQPEYLSDLLSENLIVREPGSGTRNIFEKNIDLKNINFHDFKSIDEIGNLHTIINFLIEDCGISFLFKIAVKKELESGILSEIPLKDFHMQHNFSFIWNKGSVFADEYTEICKELQSYYHNL